MLALEFPSLVLLCGLCGLGVCVCVNDQKLSFYFSLALHSFPYYGFKRGRNAFQKDFPSSQLDTVYSIHYIIPWGDADQPSYHHHFWYLLILKGWIVGLHNIPSLPPSNSGVDGVCEWVSEDTRRTICHFRDHWAGIKHYNDIIRGGMRNIWLHEPFCFFASSRSFFFRLALAFSLSSVVHLPYAYLQKIHSSVYTSTVQPSGKQMQECPCGELTLNHEYSRFPSNCIPLVGTQSHLHEPVNMETNENSYCNRKVG